MAKLKHRLINRKLTHNDTLYALEDIERITLQVFRDHLPEPTHSMILRRNPKSMEEAYRYIVEVQQQFYTQSGSLASDQQAATFSTSHKQQPHGVGMGGVGVSTMGLGVGMGAVGLGLSSYARQMSDKGQQQQNNLSSNSNKSYYNQGAPPVGAGKNHPMFKSIGNPTFKSFSYNGSSSSGMGYASSKKADVKQNYQQQKSQNYAKTSSMSGWKK